MEETKLNKKKSKFKIFSNLFSKKLFSTEKNKDSNSASINKIIEALFKDRARTKDKELLFESIGLMLSSGVDILIALKILKAESNSKAIKQIIDQLEEDVKNGIPVWKCFLNAELLPNNLISIIRIGEESGQLPNNIEIVIKQIRKDKEFKSKLRSASLYPAFVLIIMIVVALGIGIFVLPKLSEVYKSLDVKLPLVTRILIGIGDFLGRYGYIAVPLFLAIIALLFFILFIFSKTKIIGQTILLNTPVIKNLIIEVEISRFGYLFGALLKGGFPILGSLDLLEYSTSYFAYKNLYKTLKENIEKGYSFGQSFNEYKNISKLIPVYARQLIISGQETANLPKVLANIADTYEKKNIESTKNFEVLLEPILLIIVWIGVAFIAFSVILPIYGLTGNITDIGINNGENVGTIVEEAPVSVPNINPPSDDMITENSNTTESTEPVVAEVEVKKQTLEILPTETGQLNVRESIGGNVISSVTPGTVLEYLEFSSGWYKIKLDNGIEGWISGQYAKIL